jgi:hypothetical protein
MVITLLEYNNDFLISRERINRDSKGLKQESERILSAGGVKSEKNYRDDQLHGYSRSMMPGEYLRYNATTAVRL